MDCVSESTPTGAHGAYLPVTLAVRDAMTWQTSSRITVINDGDGVSDVLDVHGCPRPIPLHDRRRLHSRQGPEAQLRARSTL